jgi:hypothetical protein
VRANITFASILICAVIRFLMCGYSIKPSLDYSRAEVAADARRPPEADGPSTANALQHSRCKPVE